MTEGRHDQHDYYIIMATTAVMIWLLFIKKGFAYSADTWVTSVNECLDACNTLPADSQTRGSGQ